MLAVNDVSFAMDRGEFVSIVGPSGCGKSTLLRLIAGLAPLTQGRITVDGTVVDEPRQDVAMMFQQPTLLPWKTTLENVLLPLQLRGRVTAGDREEAFERLELLGLRGFEHTYPRHLSGGMQQRVGLARLLSVGATGLMLDEPFAAVDELTRERLNIELLNIHAMTGVTVVFVTHNITEAVLLADRVLVMTPRPGEISRSVDVPFGRPREMAMTRLPEFQELVFAVREGLERREEAGRGGGGGNGAAA